MPLNLHQQQLLEDCKGAISNIAACQQLLATRMKSDLARVRLVGSDEFLEFYTHLAAKTFEELELDSDLYHRVVFEMASTLVGFYIDCSAVLPLATAERHWHGIVDQIGMAVQDPVVASLSHVDHDLIPVHTELSTLLQRDYSVSLEHQETFKHFIGQLVAASS